MPFQERTGGYAPPLLVLWWRRQTRGDVRGNTSRECPFGSSGARWPRSEVIDDVVGGIIIAASMGSNWLCRHCTRRCRASIDVRGSRGKHASPLLGVVRRGYIQRPEGVEAHFRLLRPFLLLVRSCGGRLQLARARQRAVQPSFWDESCWLDLRKLLRRKRLPVLRRQ